MTYCPQLERVFLQYNKILDIFTLTAMENLDIDPFVATPLKGPFVLLSQ